MELCGFLKSGTNFCQTMSLPSLRSFSPRHGLPLMEELRVSSQKIRDSKDFGEGMYVVVFRTSRNIYMRKSQVDLR